MTTTNANLLPGTLIEYQGAHQKDTAWVIATPEPARTEGLVKIRVRGETGINTDTEFDIYVKANGRAKVLEMTTEAAEAELNRQGNTIRAQRKLPVHDAGPYRDPETGEPSDGQLKTPRTSSHAQCKHESSKAARAACRKDRAIALKAGDAVEAAGNA